MAATVLPIGVGVVFNIVFDFDFTPIPCLRRGMALTFPHRGGRDNMTHINTCEQYRGDGLEGT